AARHLLAGERELWASLSGADRRHAVGVARATVAALGPAAGREIVAAALLHDVGKVESGLGTFARVAATLVAKVAGRDRMGGRVGAYLHHDVIGASLLGDAGSDALTVTWAAEHHLPPSRWTLDPVVAHALEAADD